MSQNGFQSKIWGPCAWLFIHCVALNYTPEKHSTLGYIRFFKSLSSVLPCGTCRKNYEEIIRNGPFKLSTNVFVSRHSLSKWLFHVHNAINIRTGKSLTFSDDSKGFSEMKIFYEQFRAKCDKSSGKEIGCVAAKKNGKRYRCVLMVKPIESKSKSLKVFER